MWGFFFIWFLSLTVLFLRGIPFAPCISRLVLFYCFIVFLWLYHNLFFYSPVDRLLDCFHVGALVLFGFLKQFYFGPQLWHKEVPRPGIKPVTAATQATITGSNCQILNPLHHKGTSFLALFFFFLLFRATPVAYGSSWARGQIGATAAGLHHSHSQRRIQATSVTYTTTHGNTGSLTC